MWYACVCVVCSTDRRDLLSSGGGDGFGIYWHLQGAGKQCHGVFPSGPAQQGNGYKHIWRGEEWAIEWNRERNMLRNHQSHPLCLFSEMAGPQRHQQSIEVLLQEASRTSFYRRYIQSNSFLNAFTQSFCTGVRLSGCYMRCYKPDKT